MAARRMMLHALGVLVAGLGGCARSADPAAPSLAATLVAVVPRGGASGVSPTAPIVIRFSRAMSPAMAGYAALHATNVTGPLVVCAASWSADSTTLTLMPVGPLQSGSYMLHLGGGMMDAAGDSVDMMPDGLMLGGDWATGTMMMSGMMDGGGGETGPGWQGMNGMCGMTFAFTTP